AAEIYFPTHITATHPVKVSRHSFFISRLLIITFYKFRFGKRLSISPNFRRQQRGIPPPCYLVWAYGCFFGRIKSFFHAGGQPVGQNLSVFMRTVIILPGHDIAAGSVKMKMKDARLLLALIPAYTHGITTDSTFFVIVALRVRSIIRE